MIIRLPKNTFGKKINCYAILARLRKNETYPNTISTSIENNLQWGLGRSNTIPFEKMIRGDWRFETCSYIHTNVSIKRGRISSNCFSPEGVDVFHCSNKVENARWVPKVVKVKETPIIQEHPLCNTGDIIINRIGNMAGYWCVNVEKARRYSDCLIIISNPPLETINKLKSNSIDGRLNIPLRGLTTQFITQHDIISLLND